MRNDLLAPFAAAILLAALFVWSGTRLRPVAPEEKAVLKRAADRVLRGERETAEKEAWTERAGDYLDLVGGDGPAAGGGGAADTVEAVGRFIELAHAVERIAAAEEGKIVSFMMEREGEEVRLRLLRGAAEGEER